MKKVQRAITLLPSNNVLDISRIDTLMLSCKMARQSYNFHHDKLREAIIMIIKRLGILFRDVCHFSINTVPVRTHQVFSFFFYLKLTCPLLHIFWTCKLDMECHLCPWYWPDMFHSCHKLVLSYASDFFWRNSKKHKYESRVKNNNCYPVNQKPLVTLTCTVPVNCTEAFWHLCIPSFTALAVSTHQHTYQTTIL